MAGKWIKLHKEKFNKFYSLTNIMTMIKKRMMRRTEHEARKGNMRSVKLFV
jgi:hypothetical protein